jgi:uncharacterized protein
MKKDYIENINNAERRFYSQPLSIETREGSESRTITGYAAKFNSDSEDFGGWIERIDIKAFENVLNDDAVALFNHDPNLILARNKVNLTLSVDEVGLKYSFESPNTTAGNDLLENIRLGNVRQSSFAFTTSSVKWEEPSDRSKPSIRTIMKVARLYDVSPVTYPAYPDTTVGARSFKSNENYKIELRKKRHEIFALKNR